MAGGAGGGGRAGREPVARGQTTREKQVAAFCKEQTHRQTSKMVEERDLDARVMLEPRSQNSAGWENGIGRKDIPPCHGLIIGLFSDFCALNKKTAHDETL